MAHTDTSSRLTRSFYYTFQRLKSVQISLYEKAVDLSEAFDELVSDSFGTLSRPRWRKSSSQAAALPPPVDPDRYYDDADETALVSRLQDSRQEYDEITPTSVLMLIFGCVVFTLYVMGVYLRRRRRRRQQSEEARKLLRPNIHTPDIRLQPPGASFAIPVYFRPQIEACTAPHKRTSTSQRSASAAAAAGDAGRVGQDHQLAYDPQQTVGPQADGAEDCFSPGTDRARDGTNGKSLGYHEHQRQTSRTMTTASAAKTATITSTTQRNLSRLVVGPPENCTSMTGELLVYALDLSGNPGEQIGTSRPSEPVQGITHGQSNIPFSPPSRRAGNGAALPGPQRGRRVAHNVPLPSQAGQTREKHEETAGRSQPQQRRPWRTQFYQGPAKHPPPPPLPQHPKAATTANVARHPYTATATVTTASPARYDGMVYASGSSTSTRRSRSVSPGRGQRQALRWRSSPVKCHTQKPWHPFQIQAPTGHIPTAKPRAIKPEPAEPITRWAGGLPRERICEIRQKSKHAEAITTDKITKSHASPIEKQRTPVRTKPATALSSATPKRYRENATSVKRRERPPYSPQTKANESKATTKKSTVGDGHRNKASSAVVTDGRPRFKTDWTAFFTSITAKHPKKKKTRNKGSKKKSYKPTARLDPKTSVSWGGNKDSFPPPTQKPKPTLPIRPLASPMKAPVSFTGEKFEIRKTATPHLSSLSGQGAFTSYVRQGPPSQEPSAPPNSQSSSTWTSDLNGTSALNTVTSVPESGPETMAPPTSGDTLEFPATIALDPQRNQARHNTRFLSTTEPPSSSNDASLITSGPLAEGKGATWRTPCLFKGKVQQTLTSNVPGGQESRPSDLNLSKGSCFKFKEIRDVWLDKQRGVGSLIRRKDNAVECLRENNGQPVCFNSNLFNSSSFGNTACNITLSQESRRQTLDNSFSVNLQQLQERVRTKSQDSSMPEQGHARTTLRNASPLQFEMPMQEPLLSDIVQTFNPNSKTIGSLCRKKSGMGAYLEEASKLSSTSKTQPENSKERLSSGNNVSGPFIKKDTTSALKGNTVFRITRNRVTTLKTQQGLRSKATVESRPQTRKQLLQQQDRASGKRTVNTGEAVSNALEHSLAANTMKAQDKKDSTPPPYSIVTTEQTQPHQAKTFHVRRIEDSSHKGFIWQGPTDNNAHIASSKNGLAARPKPQENISQGGEEYDISPTGFLKLKAPLLNKNRDQEKYKVAKGKERNTMAQNVYKPDFPPKFNRHKEDGRSFKTSMEETNMSQTIAPKATQETLAKQPAVKAVPPETINPSVHSSRLQACFEDNSHSINSDSTAISRDGTLCSPGDATSVSSTPKHSYWAKSRKAKKSRSLLSVTDILTKLSSSTILTTGGYSPTYRNNGTHRQTNKVLKTSRRSTIFHQQKSFHDNLNKFRSRRQGRKSVSKENSIESKFVCKHPLGSPLASREGSVKGSYVRFYKMKKKSKPLRHEPYHKMNTIKSRDCSSISRAHRVYQARNKNNCSPLHKCHTRIYTPMLGNLRLAGQPSPYSDSISMSSEYRDRQAQESLSGTAMFGCRNESDENSEHFSLPQCQGSVRTELSRRSKPVTEVDRKGDYLMASKMRSVSGPPYACHTTADQPEVSTDDTTAKASQVCGVNPKQKQRPKKQHFEDNASKVSLGKNSAISVVQTKAFEETLRHERPPQKGSVDQSHQEIPADPSCSLSVPTTKSHTTQTETSTLVSQSIAIQTSPRQQRQQRAPARHRCQSSHIIQQLIRHRSREMRLERSLRHTQSRAVRTRTHPFTAHWVFQQNRNMHKSGAVQMSTSMFVESPKTGFDETKTTTSALGDVAANAFQSHQPNSKINMFGALHSKNMNQTNVRSHLQGETDPSDSTRVIQDVTSKNAKGQPINKHNQFHYAAELVNCRKEQHVTFKQQSSPRERIPDEQTAHKRDIDQQESPSSKMSEVHKMCLLRPSWKNVNIEEVDRRVKRALRLRHELQLSRSSGRRESMSADVLGDLQETSSTGHALKTMDTLLPEHDDLVYSSDSPRSGECFTNTHPGQHKLSAPADEEYLDSTRGQRRSCPVFNQESAPVMSTVPKHEMLRQDSFVYTERSMSLQDFPTAVSTSACGPERPSSVHVTSGPDFNFGNNYLKRGNLGTRSKNSPPTKISKVDNQAFNGGTPRLVGALVQRLPQVPLSSFVEWFIETSDPKNFAAASEKSRTLSDDKSSGSKSASGEETVSTNKRQGAATQSSVLTEFQGSQPDPPRHTPETTTQKGSDTVTPSNTGGFSSGVLTRDSRQPFKFGSLKPGDKLGMTRNESTRSDHGKGRGVFTTKSTSVTYPTNASTTNQSYLTDSTPYIAHTPAYVERRHAQRQTMNGTHTRQHESHEVTSTDEGGRARKNSRTYTYDEDTATLDNTVDTNKMYFKAPLHSCFDDSDDGDNDDDTVDFTKHRNKDKTERHVGSNNTRLGEQDDAGLTPTHEGQPTQRESEISQEEKPKANRTTHQFQFQELNVLQKDEVSNAGEHMTPTTGKSREENEDSPEQRCAPGIRNILMRLQQSEDDTSPHLLNTQSGRVRITLRRSSDVSGIIAKFQDQNNSFTD